MRHLLLVIRYEMRATMRKRSFWFMTLLFPLIIVGMNVGTQIMTTNLEKESDLESQAQDLATRGIGYVDRAGLISSLPGELPPGLLRAYPDESAAMDATRAGEIGRYAVIPADHLQTGKLRVILDDFQPLAGEDTARLVRYVITANLLSDDQLAAAVADPSPAGREASRAVRLSPDPERGQDSGEGFGHQAVPYAVLFLLFFVITSSGGFVLQSVAKEKENRTVEILLLSLRPRELLMGKVLGMGVVALVQVVIWLAAGRLLLGGDSQLMGQSIVADLPPAFVIYTLLYIVLGYLLYSSALAALAAMSPRAQDAAQFQFVILIPLFVPMMLNYVLLQEPDGALSTFFSLFPLTAPVSMMTRLALTMVPTWQVIAGLAGLALTTYVIVLLSARFYRADTLLSSQALDLRRIIHTFKG